MMKIKTVGDSYALISGAADPGENGRIPLRVAGEGIAALSVNGRGFPLIDGVARVPVTAFATGSNRISLRKADGRTVPCAGIRLTGGLFSPERAEIGDVVAACDKRFSALDAAVKELTARVRSLEEEFGILP
ncbi:MAG: hypothetical protein J6X72_07205 [Clostridia bacterium]|nr:hypothetical protein [Clostridia bacterium]